MRFADLSRTELGRLAERAVLVLPVGACEQHGPHLPVGTDHVLIDRVAVDAAARVAAGPVLVAPTVAVGYSEHHVLFGGTLSVSPDTLRRYLADCCESAIRSGFRRIFILNGHGGNVDVVGDVARVVSTRSEVPIASGSYWTIAADALAAAGAHNAGLVPGHAGAFETAVAAAARPDWVVNPPARRDWTGRAQSRGFRIDDPTVWRRNDGYTDNPVDANPADGLRYLDVIIDAVAHAFEDFFEKTDGGPGGSPHVQRRSG